MGKFTLVIHGGAGGGGTKDGKVIPVDNARTVLLENALRAGAEILAAGGTALDAVEAGVMSMEDCPAFNAGRGSVFTSEGKHEMDASIMDGRTMACGAVAGLGNTRNPIKAARFVMEKTPHVFFAGEGAETIARTAGLQQEPQAYFDTDARRRQLEDAIARNTVTLSEDEEGKVRKAAGSSGTVGAVAIDAHGNFAAATTTGGMTNKLPGRVGDTPVVGAGTYAKNGTLAISATGHGEVFISQAICATASAYIDCGIPFAQALEKVVHENLPDGAGGVVAVGPSGEVATPFNSKMMNRGWIDENLVPHTAQGLEAADPRLSRHCYKRAPTDLKL
eukprot:SAG31_NODE_363_length_16899_cov_9.812976_8_plen_334_part_00